MLLPRISTWAPLRAAGSTPRPPRRGAAPPADWTSSSATGFPSVPLTAMCHTEEFPHPTCHPSPAVWSISCTQGPELDAGYTALKRRAMISALLAESCVDNMIKAIVISRADGMFCAAGVTTLIEWLIGLGGNITYSALTANNILATMVGQALPPKLDKTLNCQHYLWIH
ncbi:uncharacterized protein LOC144376345 [Ictidomys tridecemlineatus]